jgi:tetratricopeptide (TPR) repeat protein
MFRIFLCSLLSILFCCASINAQQSQPLDSNFVNVLNEEAYNYWYTNLDTVLLLAGKQLVLSKQINYTLGAIRAHIDFWHVYNDRQDFVKAATHGLEALTLSELIRCQKYLAVSYSNLGLTYQQMSENEVAIEYFNKAYEIDKKRNNLKGIASDFINMATVYSDQGKDSLALKFQMDAFAIKKLLKDDVGCGIAMLGAARSSSKLGFKELAIKRAKDALQFALKANDIEGQAYAYDYIARFSGSGLPAKQSLELSLKSLELAKQLRLKELERDNYFMLSYNYERSGQIFEAFDYMNKASGLTDTLYRIDKKVSIARLESKFQIEKKQAEIKELKKDMEEKQLVQRRQMIIAVGTVGVVLVGVVFFFLYRNAVQAAKNSKSELENAKKELSYLKDQTNPHFLLNALNGLYGISLLSPALISDKIAELSFLLHYQLKVSQLDKISVKDEIEFVRNYIEFIKQKTTKLRFEFEVNRVDEDRTVPPLIFFPIIENALKYSSEMPFPVVNIKWENTPEKIVLIVENNFEAVRSKISGTGVGIANLRRRLALHAYRFDFETEAKADFYVAKLTIWDKEFLGV